MLNGISFYTADEVWRQMLIDLGAEFSEKSLINFDSIKPASKISAVDLCGLVLSAADTQRAEIISNIAGKAKLSDVQEKIIIALYLKGSMDSKELHAAIGHAVDADTHAAATAISAMRNSGLDVIKNVNGKYEVALL